jgi:FlaA1/EpsC-like NDP-sugar epimerase
MRRFLEDQAPYGLVLNFAALKHVRSEKDGYSLLQMFETNVLKAERLLGWLVARGGTTRYFSVSTDKAANPVNLMGASKRLMEHTIFAGTRGDIAITSARFANVAFSAGSLLEGWLLRLEKGQPLAVPRATRRYFLSLREAGQLCLLAAVAPPHGTIVIPRLDAEQHLVDLEGIARALLAQAGFTAKDFENETAARNAVSDPASAGYPLLLTPLDTAGEKPYEEFVGAGESVFDLGLPNLSGIHHLGPDPVLLGKFLAWLAPLVDGTGASPEKEEFVAALEAVVPELRHQETHKQLDQRM